MATLHKSNGKPSPQKVTEPTHAATSSREDPADNAARSRKPSFLGARVWARKDPNKEFAPGNTYWRRVVSEEEAAAQRELHVGDDLRQRLIGLMQQGYFEVPQEELDGIIELREEEG